jgi:uncharacterized protein DUF2750
MLQSQATSAENYQRFVERVRNSGEVWGLKSDNWWANCPSNHDENKDVLVFWSDRAYAARHAKEGWSGYEPTSISLDSFISRWLPGMHEDGVLVGPNWDAHLCGLEVEPLEVSQKLTHL